MKNIYFPNTYQQCPVKKLQLAFFEAINTRALQLSQTYHLLQAKAKKVLPALLGHLGDLVGVEIDSIRNALVQAEPRCTLTFLAPSR